MNPALRDLVIQRDRWCAVCALPLPVHPAVHHRKLRKHGGPDSPENLIALHHSCHSIAPRSVHQNPTLAYSMGWLVKSWDDPAQVPVQTADGRTVSLLPDGGIKEEGTHGW